MDLLALADFTLVARHGGFGKAAHAARRPKATLSRRVGELEAALDLRLFERGRRDLKLTEEGRALFERSVALLTELEETATAIALGSERVRGRLRISAPLLFSQTAMGRLAAEFARRPPQVRLEVTTDDWAVDMIEEGYDLVIRVNPAPDETLVGRSFLHDRMVVVARPDMLRPTGAAVPAVVRGVDADGAQGRSGAALVVTCHDLRCRARGSRAGPLPLSLVSRDIADGRLAHWGDVAGSEIALWALYPTRRLLNARVSAFLDLLRHPFPQAAPEELAAYLDR
ncbi:LysR family transcriptional regulator [Novosphingobium sp. RD2P27]|uniref:LysR family transcriptional regulator n=1 Tax=Novosphingobium kalidii TaxID=3230299 RepID=A0ABV2CZP8_9SPHN